MYKCSRQISAAAPYIMHSLILLNVFQTSDKSITLMRSRLGYFYLGIHFCPLTKIIKMDSSEDYQQFLPAPLISFTALSLSRKYFVKYLLSVLFFVHKHHPGNSTPTQHLETFVFRHCTKCSPGKRHKTLVYFYTIYWMNLGYHPISWFYNIYILPIILSFIYSI